VNSAELLSSSVWRDRSRLYFTIGLALGGTTTVLLALTLGSLVLRPFVPDIARLAVLAAMALFVVAGEFGLHRVSLPHRRAQVPTSVVGEGARRGALQFGYEMGTGMRTHMPSNQPYVPLLATILVTSLGQALLVGVGFAIGRAWMALGRYYGRNADWWDSVWAAHEKWLRRVLVIALIAQLVIAEF
jgi:hypothetical protein